MASVEALPRIDRYVFDEESPIRGAQLEFRLVYKGRLPSESGGSSRPKEKHAMRKIFHQQLHELWQRTPALKWQLTDPVHVYKIPSNNADPSRRDRLEIASTPEYANSVDKRTFIDWTGDQFSRNGYRFVPLLRELYGTTCALDILFLRRDSPGDQPLIKSGGDIDNRLKVLFDALRMPANKEECGGFSPDQNESPFFCLLEDDRLITDVNVTTDRLLIPRADDEHIHDVELVIGVKTKVIDKSAFLSHLY
jgi:hypothetical protein